MLVPISALVSLVLLGLIPVGWAAWRIALVTVGRSAALAIAPALALASWVLSMHVTSYVTRSFHLGLVVGTLLLASVSILAWWRRHGWLPLSEGRTDPSPKWYLHGRWVGSLLSMLLVAPAALGWNFHDEINITGHLSIASQIQNGVYPPHHLSMAQYELKYHYGFDLLVAALGALLHIRVDHVIDALTLLSWGLCWLLLWELGSYVFRSHRGAVLAPIVLFGGGLPVVGESAYTAALSDWVGGSTVDQAFVSPPVVSYLFQHPWTLGLPIALALLRLFCERHATTAISIASSSLLFLALAHSQVVLFASLGAAIPTAALVSSWTNRSPGSTLTAQFHRVWPWMLAPLMALVIASLTGGMFASTPTGESMLLLRWGPTVTIPGALQWDLAVFGLMLPLGIVGAGLLLRRGIAMPALLIVGALIVIHSVAHKITWDIAKFSVIAHLGLAWGLCEVLLRLDWKRWTTRFALVIAGAIVLHSGLAFASVFALMPKGVPSELLAPEPAWFEQDDWRMANELRQMVRPGDVMIRRRKRVAYAYAEWAGIAQIWMDPQTVAFGYPKELIEKRQLLTTQWPSDISLYTEHGVRWLVVEEGPKDDQLLNLAQAWEGQGQAVRQKSIGTLTLFELVDSRR